ncbi:MAG TPA: DUF3014 domain-containing protein [Steroidobacteraceae bacterium]
MNDDQKKWIYYAIPIAVAVALAGALYYGKRYKEQETAPAVAEAPVAPAEEPVHHPIETPPSDEPLPTLEESDAPLQQSLREIFGAAVDKYLVPKELIRRFVVTVDNLPRKKTAVDRWPVKPLGGEFRTSGTDVIVLSPANAERYKPLVDLVTSADTSGIVAMYKRFYPLLQQAYVDLGYPEGYFNNRLIEVIDHLLETPEVEGPIKLVQPGVFYEFADPSLESRSSGQKLLLRMGNENAAAIKLKLREIRREIAQRD